ncbi:MAG: hypothetical protein JWN27_360 [Candidatus Eremiobacteraeota bacterium]|nr:hypothetical protein [Candidatus Eremiobacteraeota bacterium]
MTETQLQRIAVVTPSFARDYHLCRELNRSVLRFWPEDTKHYLVVDRQDLALFRPLAGPRTVVVAVEEVVPSGYFKVPGSKKWWLSTAALYPAKGWLIQQLVKLSMPHFVEEEVLVNVDSDVRFVRPVDPSIFAREGKTRLYRLPRGITPGMTHVKWHYNVCKALGVAPDPLPMDDYVNNVISWDKRIAVAACARIERVTGVSWHVALTRMRLVSEYLTYGLYVDKVIGHDAAQVWIEDRTWCHTYWGPGPLSAADVKKFVDRMPPEDVAFSIAGYTGTDPIVTGEATRLVLSQVGI